MKKAAMQQVLDTLLNSVPCTSQQIQDERRAIKALQEAIAQPVPPALEPLSNNHIYKLKNEHPSSALAFARAIEKAHGINSKETS